MSYLVFARKFRPQTFDDVIGQEPITTTLKNAIAKGRVAQSFLFTGSRGVGKTSTARILAKALICEKGPSPEPCNRCSICEEVTGGSSLDVLEIDGASNRGIDEIRSLRENVKFKPAHARYKIYIIDEVHMLTGEAFNALLKTLEEPPGHVKFIFATTEAHKVPLTILSRCQRFNFKRIPTVEIAGKLKEIAKKEKIKVGEKTLFVIAKSAEGSLRDGESLLDQLASFGAGTIEEEDVIFSLGLTSDEALFLMLEALERRDAKAILQLIHKSCDEGKDLHQLAEGFLGLMRDLLVLQVGGKELVEAPEDRLHALGDFQGKFARDELLFAITLLQQLIREIHWAHAPRFLLESCFLKIADLTTLRSIDALLSEVKGRIGPSAGGPLAGKGLAPKEEPAAGRGPASPAVRRDEPAKAGKKKADFALKTSEAQKTAAPTVPARGALPESAESKPASAVTLNDVWRVWPDLLERVKAAKMSCGTYLSESEPMEVQDGLAVLGFPIEFKFHKEAIEHRDNKELVRRHLTSLLGRDIGVSFVLTEAEKVEQTKPAEEKPKDPDVISAAINIFDGSKVVYRDP